MSVEAMKQALEALEDYVEEYGPHEKDSGAAYVITALRQAIAEAEDAVAAEREACAKVCDAVQKKNEDDGAFMWEARNCAAAIRARGEK